MREVEMSTKYDPTAVEAGRYQAWLDEKLFAPEANQAIQGQEPAPYSVVIPPPNVTGKLHLGHAWDTTLQDMIIRQKRMQGFDTLWLPGMDHAGIATQAKVEQRLAQDGISRYDLGRDKFVEQVWDWKNEYAATIKEQWGKLGLSVDYDRERFTLDSGLNQAVNKVFIDLYNKGLIYRGEYIINWDPKARTALSDIEVVYQDDEGAFYHVKYPFVDGTTLNGQDYIEIATTRPETMFGDVAVAVNPTDERYQDLIGKKVLVPLVGREIPIIADDYVEKDFGTGMVKITPAHDPNDFQVGNRHQLERINTMTEDAHMTAAAGPYAGLDRFEARKAIEKDLADQGYLLKVDPYVHSVGHSERTGVQIESRLSTQWFVKMAPLAEQILAMQQNPEEKVNFVPGRFEDTFTRWMENIRDWVISRQLWWGHQIPAWYKHKGTAEEEIFVGEAAPDDSWERDPDVLDTWFSSALWPFSTMGWPDVDSADFQRYYPTNTLVTGYDIIFFWVARMMFQGKEFTGERPFKDVLIHGLIRDGQGRKMSKSLGNGVDPMDVIQQYGADALRWFLATGSTPGQDVRFTYEKMDSAWNFINKIWNAARYVIMNLDDDTQAVVPDQAELTLADQWILSRLNAVIEAVTKDFDRYDFGEAGRVLYNFIWSDFADWYIEMTKETLASDGDKRAVQATLAYVLEQILKLMQPIMPFVTEAIWQEMPAQQQQPGQRLAVQAYPTVNPALTNPAAEKAFASLQDLIVAVRNIRAEAKAPMSTPVDLLVNVQDQSLTAIFQDNADYIDRFVKPKSLTIAPDLAAPKLSMSQVISGAEVYVPLAGLINIEAEISRLQGEAKKYEQEVARANGKLQNEKFVNSAPEKVVAAEREKLADWQAKADAVAARIAQLQAQ
ncbi:valine--tRNA ligase [Leuconostocaceae bacterium ESL0958]|nr:valine--tRNA ligase [Leuconostocaceae bacterium ESL0958]